jgi:CxxC motif-containing protein
MRTLTTTVTVEGSARRRLPVRSSGELPLSRLLDAMAALDPVIVRPPVVCGEIVLRDILGLGVDMIATDDLPSEQTGATDAR